MQKRVAGPDAVRALAIVCVIGGHFFINTGFNQTDFASAGMFILSMVQTFTLIGVPLFLMLTGYLNINKTQPSRKYFRGIWRVLIAYLFFSVVTILFRKYWLGHEKTMLQWVLEITSFSAIPYAWYIEMWIGLFLLTPFLSRLWHAIESKHQHLILIAILFVCAALPDFTNRYGLHLLPGYWTTAAYPLLSFFIGAYIRTYQPKFSTSRLLALIVALCLFNPVLSMILAYGKPMLHLHGGPGGIVSIPIAVCTFMMFYQREIRNLIAKATITKISLLSLDMYLVAYLVDQLLYPVWQTLGMNQQKYAVYYIPVIASLVITGFVLAYVKDKALKIAGNLKPKKIPVITRQI